MELVPLHCPVCGSAIPGEEVHLDLQVARCVACRAVFDLAGRQLPGRAPPEPPPAPRARVPLPPRFQVDDRGHAGMAVRWRWFRPATLFLAFFCVVWDGFLVFWYGIAFLVEDAPLMMLLFPLLHVAVGVVLTYSVLAQFLNHTELQVSRGRLQIRHGPLPWGGNKDLAAASLKQLYGVEKISRGKNGVTVTYTLNAIDREGAKRELLTDLQELEQVLWLEQALERHLGIEDQPVAGEVARRSA